MLTRGVPLGAETTVGRWLAGASRSPTILPVVDPALPAPAAADCCAATGITSPTQPNASHSEKLIGLSAAVDRPSAIPGAPALRRQVNSEATWTMPRA